MNKEQGIVIGVEHFGILCSLFLVRYSFRVGNV